MNKVCLVIIFNHRFDKNISKIKSLYKDKFSNIVMLVPFYDGQEEGVIPVYESSYQFPGYLIQAYEKLVKIDADRYVFSGDDVLLNPELTENNIIQELGMSEKKAFIRSISKLNRRGSFGWAHAFNSSVPFLNKATNWKESLPIYEEAKKRFEDFFNEPYEDEYTEDFFYKENYDKEKLMHEKLKFIQLNGNTNKIPYPQALGYSDFVILSKDILFSVARLSGIFSAMNVFAEIALPTAIVLTLKREEVVVLSDTKYTAIVNWGRDRVTFGNRNEMNIENLYRNWKSNNLFIHPIKLSMWSMPEAE